MLRGLGRSDQEYLIRIFANQKYCPASPELKLRVYESLLRLKTDIKKPFGFLMVLGWKNEWNEQYLSAPDVSQNIFERHPFYFEKISLSEAVSRLGRTVDFDGAVLISSRGRVFASGAYLENMKPKQTIEKMGVSRYEDLSQAYGFSRKVHTRHLAGIAASYLLKSTLVYVVSEEDRSLRVFENGKIICSPYREEILWNKNI